MLAIASITAMSTALKSLLELLDRLAPEGGAAPDMRRLFDFTATTLASLECSEPRYCGAVKNYYA